MGTTIHERVQARIEELRTLRDQVRVDVHLAGRELRDEWQQLEKRLPDLTRVADDIKGAASDALDALLEEARRFRSRLGDHQGADDATVSRLMTREVTACGPESSLAEAAGKMWTHDIGCLPVVDADGRAVAMITDRDAAMAAFIQGRPLADIAVRTAMSRTLFACSPQAAPREVEETMMARQIRRMPVVEADGRLVGVVTVGDLALAAHGLDPGKPHGGLSADAVTSTLAAIVEPRRDRQPRSA
jgi:CBS domain-containing protein